MNRHFFLAYLEAALWSSTDDGGEPLDKNYGIDDIAPECLREMAQDCADFVDSNYKLLAAAKLRDAQTGHDFWLTRNGHGAGFWDRGLPGRLGQKLTEASKPYGSFDLYVGDDGRIYGCS